jgi:hypothetical protein
MVEIYNICNWRGHMERHYFPQNSWVIPAAERDGPPTRLVITDCYQWHRRLSADPRTRQTITASEIADDFIKQNVTEAPHYNELGGPGMWRHDPERSLEEEVRIYQARFRTFCQRMVDEAEDWDRRRRAGTQHVARPTDRHRECAAYLLYKASWCLDFTPNIMKQCDNCGEVIGATLYTCPNCNFVLDPVGLDALKAKKKAELLAAQALQRQQNAALAALAEEQQQHQP